jgi:hypothetical protein
MNIKKDNKGIRTKCVMYVQYLDHLGFDSVEALEKRIQTTKPKEYALIVHNKDKQEDGSTKKPSHVHAVIYWDSYRRLTAIAKEFNDKPQYFEIWKGKRNNAYLYLTHRTKNAIGKFKYDVNEVKSNFDYPGFVEKQVSSFNKAQASTKAQEIDQILDKLDSLEMSYKDALDALSGSQYGKAHSQLKAVWQRVRKREADKWAKDMNNNNQTVNVLWFYGGAGLGKTSAAMKYAEAHYKSDEIYLSGSSRDPFQAYGENGTFEKCVILDELRPRVFPYNDLLRMLDPYVKGTVAAGSRYSDKYLMAETIIITTPFSPIEFYEAYGVDDEIDSFTQLSRRLGVIIEFTQRSLLQKRWGNEYDEILGEKPNEYFEEKEPERSQAVLAEI